MRCSRSQGPRMWVVFPLPVLRERVRVRVFFVNVETNTPHPNPLPEYRERE
jgi:hypothetical protein